ncbi:hypothetical protein NIES4071_06040 [Calothrix sp. NIES-4071]|nr:hypothetical protein NIES4071_06040 [Calothrix sp. NIES-4071]BAZ54947.1 hypothetical protein NIES4105_06010 [Calothrix sp. NIES-4105]
MRILDKVTAVGYPGLVEMSEIFDKKSLVEATFTNSSTSGAVAIVEEIEKRGVS